MKPPTPWLRTKETSAACKAFMQNSKAGVEDVPLVCETIPCQQLRAAARCSAAKTLTSPPFTLWPPLLQSGEGRAAPGRSLQISSTQPTLSNGVNVKLPQHWSSAANSLAT